MSRRIWIDLLLVMGVFGLIFWAFTYFSKPVSISEDLLPSEKKEKLIKWIEEQIAANYTIMEDHQWALALDEVMERLVLSGHLKHKDYEVVVLTNPNLNAFATLGSNLYVFSGLLEKIDNHEEIAAVLAHEIAHVELNHVEQKLISEFGLVVLTGIITGGDFNLGHQILKDLSTGVFSRKQESAADDFALDLMMETGIDPVYLGVIFKKLKDAEDMDFSLNIEILQSHPDINKRIRKAFEYPKGDFAEIPFYSEWPHEIVEESE